MLVSSANIINVSSLLTKVRSFKYIIKSNGPSIEPCGTPQVTGNLFELEPLVETNWCLLVR